MSIPNQNDHSIGSLLDAHLVLLRVQEELKAKKKAKLDEKALLRSLLKFR